MVLYGIVIRLKIFQQNRNHCRHSQQISGHHIASSYFPGFTDDINVLLQNMVEIPSTYPSRFRFLFSSTGISSSITQFLRNSSTSAQTVLSANSHMMMIHSPDRSITILLAVPNSSSSRPCTTKTKNFTNQFNTFPIQFSN